MAAWPSLHSRQGPSCRWGTFAASKSRCARCAAPAVPALARGACMGHTAGPCGEQVACWLLLVLWTYGPPASVQVLCITLGICVATWAFVFVALLAMAPYLPMTAGLAPRQTFGVISLAATLMMARSPASMVTHPHPQAHLPKHASALPYSRLAL